MIYPITSIFRTGLGPLPAYRFAPYDIPGVQELSRPLLLLSEDQLHAVTKVCVHPYANFVILQGPRTWTGVPDGHYTESTQLDTLLGYPARVTAPDKRADLPAIMNIAMLAGMHSCGVNAGQAALYIMKLGMHELRTEPLAPGEYGTGLRFLLPVQDMKPQHFDIFLYTFLCVSFRFFRFKKTSREKQILVLTMKNLFWRDYIVQLMLIAGLRVRCKVERERTFAYLDASEFAYFVRRVFVKNPDIPFRDFKMAYTLLGKHVAHVDENMQEILSVVDNTIKPFVERVEYSVSAATCPGVSFPEISEFIEANSMIVRQQ